ncbi:MAG: hypothetical protein CME62_03575 [Halobacteriovoraceae bacterium]|nr:hypothetical protein [Halobacteriovoraceae bacterium]
MQKFITFTLIFSVLGASAFAEPTCDELRKDLLALEYKIQMSTLEECPEGSEGGFCQRGGNNNFTLQYYGNIENDYNKALAELILAQGLKAISNTITGSYNSITALNETNIDQATEYINVLERNLTKAEMLEKAMVPVTRPVEAGGVDSTDEVSFLSKYRTYITENISEGDFKIQIREICNTQVDSDGELCSYLKNNIFNDQANDDFLETLRGFFIADHNSRKFQDEDPEDDYCRFRNYLLIGQNSEAEAEEDDGNDTTEDCHRRDGLTASEFRELNFGQSGNVERPMERMRNAIVRFNQENLSPELKERRTREVFEADKVLDPIDVTYSNMNLDSNYQSMSEFMQRHFKEPLDNLKVDPTDRVVSEIWKNNLDNMISEYENKIKVFDKGRDVLTTKGISEHVADDQGGLNADRLQRTFSQVLGKLNSARECYDRPTLLAKQECLNSVDECISTPDPNNPALNICGTLEEKRRAVADAKRKLDFYNQGQPFQRLKTLKGLTLNSLEREGCHQENDRNLLENKQFACDRDLNVDPSQQLLSLGDELDNIQIRIDQEWVEQSLLRPGSNALETFQTDRDEFMARECAGNRTEESVTRNYLENTCRFFEARREDRREYDRELREREENRVAAQRRARAMRMSRSYTLGESRRSGLAIGATSAATTLVGHIPTLTATYLQGRQVKDTREQVYSYIAAREQQRVDQMEALQACQANPTTACGAFRYQQYNAYQFQLAQTGFNGMTNFQAGMGGSQFNNPGNPYSFSFSTNTNPSLNLTNDNTSAFGSFGNTSTTDSTTGPANGATPFSF